MITTGADVLSNILAATDRLPPLAAVFHEPISDTVSDLRLQKRAKYFALLVSEYQATLYPTVLPGVSCYSSVSLKTGV